MADKTTKPRTGWRTFAGLGILALMLGHGAAAHAGKILEDEIEPDWIIGESGPHERPQDLALMLSVWPDTLGVGVWYGVPVLPNGFLKGLNDSFVLELGAVLGAYRSAYYWSGSHTTIYAISPSAGGRWNFHLTRNATVFATLKVGARFGSLVTELFDPGASLGALFRIRPDVALRLELGFPMGFSLGLSWGL